MSISQSYLLGLFSSAGSASSSDLSLLNAAYGIGTATSSGTGADPVQALATAQQTETSAVKQTAATPAVQTAIAQFTKAVNSATSVSGMLANPAVMNVLLTAGGMTDQIGNTALATQVLMSNLKDTNSLANTLTDTRWKTLAQTYDFNANGLKALQNPKTIAAVANGYAQITWENSQDTVTPGLSNALAFIQQASTITSVDQLLGNATVRDVVTTAFNIPQQIAFQSISAQEQAISSRLNVSQLQDPKFVQQLAQQYLIENSQNASDSSSSPTDLTSLAVQAQGIIA